MAESKPNPEHLQPDSTARNSSERSFVPLEFYKHFELAKELLDWSDQVYIDEEIDYTSPRDLWDDPKQPLKYNLLERQHERGTYYELHAWNWLTQETINYYFSDWWKMTADREKGGSYTILPPEAISEQQITNTLFQRYLATNLAQKVDQKYDDEFSKIMGWFSAELVIGQEFSDILLTETGSNDTRIRNNAFLDPSTAQPWPDFEKDQNQKNVFSRFRFFRHRNY